MVDHIIHPPKSSGSELQPSTSSRELSSLGRKKLSPVKEEDQAVMTTAERRVLDLVNKYAAVQKP
jgi:hypothetical protein